MPIITKHADKRVRKRLGLPRRAVEKMAERALQDGARHSDFNGSLRRYLDKQYLAHGCTANNMRVHGGHLFVFNGKTLITAWPLPRKYRDVAPSS